MVPYSMDLRTRVLADGDAGVAAKSRSIALPNHTARATTGAHSP